MPAGSRLHRFPCPTARASARASQLPRPGPRFSLQRGPLSDPSPVPTAHLCSTLSSFPSPKLILVSPSLSFHSSQKVIFKPFPPRLYFLPLSFLLNRNQMPGGMAPLKKPRNPTKLPLALNPTKSKDVLAVLAERNQAIIPVGAWVEPASPNCSEIPAHVSVS